MSGTLNQRLLPANITLLQPGSQNFRLSDALHAQAAINTMVAGGASGLHNVIETLRAEVATLQQQVQSLQQFQRSFDYLQTEISTGSIFLDQRTIYRRSFVISNALPVNSVLTYPHTIPQVSYFVDIRAELAQQAGQAIPITFVNTAQTPPWVNGVSVWADAVNFYFSNGNTPWTSYLLLVTAWYTATNR